MPTARVDSALLALLLCACCQGPWAAELGTLFHTPAERARLDQLRRGEPIQRAASDAPAGPREVTGYVQRSDGRNTVWIDGVARSVSTPRTAPPFDPRAVRAYADRESGALKIERKPPH